MSELKRTPLFNKHVELNAKMVDFGGWEMPVQYAGIVKEHQAVRENSGLFDVSHMGEFLVNGPDALGFLHKITSNDPQKLGIGRGLYTHLLHENGGTVDDIIVYRIGSESYLIVVNASNIDKDWQHIQGYVDGFPNLTLKDASSEYGLIALQGPKAEETLAKHVDRELSEIGFFRIRQAKLAGCAVRIARTGYTGEGLNGFEIFVGKEDTPAVWDVLVAEAHVMPCGLGARDTLRIEASLPLYGHELDDATSPIEAGLDVFVSSRNDYIGAGAIQAQRANGLKKTLVMLEMVDRGIPRQGYEICTESESVIGQITSGTVAPWIQKNIAMGFVSPGNDQVGSTVMVKIRDRFLKANVVERPFFKR